MVGQGYSLRGENVECCVLVTRDGEGTCDLKGVLLGQRDEAGVGVVIGVGCPGAVE